jgi:hypothetical protein
VPKTVATADRFAGLIAPTVVTQIAGPHCEAGLAIATWVGGLDSPSRATPDRQPLHCMLHSIS